MEKEKKSQLNMLFMKKIFIGVFVLLATFAGLYYYKNSIKNNSSQVAVQTAQVKILVYQKLYYPHSLSGKYNEQKVLPHTTALGLLKQTTKVKTRGDGQNAFVIEINDKVANDKKKEYWAFYINGKLSPVGAGSYELKNADKIEWKIENY